MNYVAELREDYHNLKQTMKLQALANYIVLEFNKFEQDEIIKGLQDQTKQVAVQISVTDKTPSDISSSSN